ncbi:hypothetical protein F53441_1283 [Fusarium austroafricanum]|uniref:Uncharacterized protein n=1 Tax=Fusarium austroafricanum TaxID=2364996 RepID=A0A8H4KSF6_9HYPO|nr:hypothetical protein F53441_1283 [Fusarium austroafricanum]
MESDGFGIEIENEKESKRIVQVKEEFLEAADIHLQNLKDIADFSNYPEKINVIIDDFFNGVKAHTKSLEKDSDHLQITRDTEDNFAKATKIHRQDLSRIARSDTRMKMIKDTYRPKMIADTIDQFDEAVNRHLERLYELECFLSHLTQAEHLIYWFDRAAEGALRVWEDYVRLHNSTNQEVDQFLRDLPITSSFVALRKSQQAALLAEIKPRMDDLLGVAKLRKNQLLAKMDNFDMEDLSSDGAINFAFIMRLCMNNVTDAAEFDKNTFPWIQSGLRVIEILEAIQNVASSQEMRVVLEYKRLIILAWGE